MTAGLFTRTYELWRLTETTDPYGNPVTEWNKVADVAGRAYPKSQADEVIAAKRTGKVIWTFAAATTADVRKGDEIRFDGRTLEVQAVSETSTGRRLEALCEETQ
jgi:SPP1 family predicted phage head-tail adaptor